MIYKGGTEQIFEHNDGSLAKRSQIQDSIFPDKSIVQHTFRNDSFVGKTFGDFGVFINTGTRNLVLTYNGTEGFTFNQKTILPNLILNAESGGQLFLRTDLNVDEETTPVTQVTFGWNALADDLKFGGYDIKIMRFLSLEGGSGGGVFPYYDEALYVVKRSLWRFTTTGVGASTYTLTPISGNAHTLTQIEARTDFSGSTSEYISYSFQVGGGDSGDRFIYRISPSASTNFTSSNLIIYFVVGSGSYYGSCFNDIASGGGGDGASPIEIAGRVYFGKYFVTSGHTVDCYFVLEAIVLGKNLIGSDIVNSMYLGSASDVKNATYVIRAEKQMGLTESEILSTINFEDRLLLGSQYNLGGSIGYGDAFPKDEKYRRKAATYGLDLAHFHRELSTNEFPLGIIPWFEVNFREFDRSRMTENRCKIVFVSTVIASWEVHIQLDPVDFSGNNVEPLECFFKTDLNSDRTTEGVDSADNIQVLSEADTTTNLFVFKTRGTTRTYTYITGLRGYVYPIFLQAQGESKNKNFCRSFEKKNGLPYFKHEIDGGGAFISRLLNFIQKNLDTQETLKTLVNRYPTIKEFNDGLYKDFRQICLQEYWISKIQLLEKIELQKELFKKDKTVKVDTIDIEVSDDKINACKQLIINVKSTIKSLYNKDIDISSGLF